MARRTITHEVVVDDLTGIEIHPDDAEAVQFAYRRKMYEIDLGPQSVEQFDAALAPFLAVARTVGHGGKAKRGAGDRPSRAKMAAVREWARANGHVVADRGRIPADIVDAYHAAHGQPAA